MEPAKALADEATSPTLPAVVSTLMPVMALDTLPELAPITAPNAPVEPATSATLEILLSRPLVLVSCLPIMPFSFGRDSIVLSLVRMQ